MNWKKYFPLIIGLGLPILLIIFTAASIYLPKFFINPKFDFIYSNNQSYNNKYYVLDSHIQINPNYREDYYPKNKPQLFYYDIKNDKSRALTYEEASLFNLDQNSKSPDGFEIVYGSESGSLFPIFFYTNRDYSTRYISGHNFSKKLNLIQQSDYYDFQFLGWIIK